jgi:multiple sugar transport system permease protein
MFPTPIEKTSRSTQAAYKIALPIALMVWLLPLIAVLLTSVRSFDDINAGNYWGWPENWQMLENYHEVFVRTPMLEYILNSVRVTVPSVIGAIALSTMAGFALACYNFRCNMLVFALFIAGNFIPFQILMIPVRDFSYKLGLYNTLTGLTLFHIAFQTGFCTLFMRNFIRALPRELIEAARVEGAGEFTIFFRIVLPLVRPALAALAVLIFTFVWNDYFWTVVLSQSEEARPVTAGISELKGRWVAQWHLISAGAIVAALPPVAMFFAMQRHFIAGLTLGATKG